MITLFPCECRDSQTQISLVTEDVERDVGSEEGKLAPPCVPLGLIPATSSSQGGPRGSRPTEMRQGGTLPLGM